MTARAFADAVLEGGARKDFRHKLPRTLVGRAFGCAAAFAEREMGVTRLELVSPRRQRHLVVARAFVVWAIKSFDNPHLSYPEIGRRIGDRDHSTIINLWRKAQWMLAHDAEFLRLARKFTEDCAFPLVHMEENLWLS